MPIGAIHVWTTFIRLHNRRGSSGFGPSPILWSDIDSFTRLSGFVLAPWELEIIEDLDMVFFAEQAKAQKQE